MARKACLTRRVTITLRRIRAARTAKGISVFFRGATDRCSTTARPIPLASTCWMPTIRSVRLRPDLLAPVASRIIVTDDCWTFRQPGMFWFHESAGILLQSYKTELGEEMARPLEFDRSDAVKRAVEAFWECGYGSISANELSDRMGIGKSSFYNTFGSKAELLRLAVGSYVNQKTAALQRAIRHQNVMDVLRALLVDVARRNDGGKGCLLVNTAIELSRHDENVAHATRAGFDAIAATFEALVISGQQAGNIRPELDPKQQARILLTSISGLRVMIQSGFTAEEMTPFINMILKSIAT